MCLGQAELRDPALRVTGQSSGTLTFQGDNIQPLSRGQLYLGPHLLVLRSPCGSRLEPQHPECRVLTGILRW